MDDSDLLRLETGTTEEAVEATRRFITKNGQSFTFPELSHGDRRRALWTLLFARLRKTEDAECRKNCLACIRMLSREKAELNELVCPEWLDSLLRLAGLVSQEEALTQINKSPTQYEVMVEAQKSLCNLVFNSSVAQALCARNHAVEGLVLRLRTYREPGLPHEVKFFDMKLLFILTALCPRVRPALREEFHGLTYLMETLDLVLKEAAGDGAACADAHPALSDEQVALACEVLKVLFNLTVRAGSRSPLDEEEEAHYLRLVSILHDLLLCEASSRDRLLELHNHIVNLLVTIPGDCYEELTTPVSRGPAQGHPATEFLGRNVEAVVRLLDFLDHRLDLAEQNAKLQHETLSPVLTVLAESARSQRVLRKFLRARVLPPLRDAAQRPEVGPALRNKLCRLLTTPATHVRDLAADLLFVLCKESVWRMVKYTGYGNAAGMFANRGLLMGGSSSRQEEARARYSSDSEDSDTEEYKKLRDQINPVTGCFEAPRPDPTASMTEEQKEYEAMQLVTMMDKLSRDGIVQPCRVGEDGRPEPVEHILQLVEDLPRQQVKPRPDDE
ncbi:synembryn-A [Bacillus rossius redtenbacheri]|uniref:synembryn-A n=1 Tax=Bacillus rossius redtenbacheri TaxID=93214 RepID=UPI002FDDBA9F